MDNIDRRNLLIGSGLALGLASCTKPACPQENKNRGPLSKNSIDPESNHGRKPWEYHPDGNAQSPAPIASRHIGILHLEFTSASGAFVLQGQRVHFDAPGSGGNELEDHDDLICQVITNLNGGAQVPNLPLKKTPGIMGIKNSRPQHVIIYIRNSGINFHEYPVIFSPYLLDGKTPAEPNGSFFEARTRPGGLPGSIQGGSKSYLYMKNYFKKLSSANEPKDPIGTNNLWYGININTTIASSDHPKSLIMPLVIDPDTGNMGTGGGDE